MPRLNNPTDYDLFAPQIHRSVPPHDGIDITDSEAAMFEGNCIFTVTESAGDEPQDDAAELSEASAPVTRRTVTRGSRRAETTAAPAMEKR